MFLIKLDIGDGRGIIECAVANFLDHERLRRFTIEAGEAMIDQERYHWLRSHEYSADVWHELSHTVDDDFDATVDASMFADEGRKQS